MKIKSFYKDLNRSLVRTKARFLSILVIISIGVGFFAGINATEPDMLLSADKYYKNNNLSDFRIISPLGFLASDIANVKNIEGVAKVQEGYTKDVFLSTSDGNTSIAKLFSYDENDYKNNEGLNIPVIIEGRMPEKSGEIAIDHGKFIPSGIKLNSKITLSLPNKEEINASLITNTYTVVGFIDSPSYIDFERGHTNIGDGSIEFFAYLSKDDFTMDKVTDLFIETTDSKKLKAYTLAYKNHIDAIEAPLKTLGTEAIAKETQRLRDELTKGKNELGANRIKMNRELASGEKRLNDSERKIVAGEKALRDNNRKYSNELSAQRDKLKTARKELEAGKALYLENYSKWLEGYNKYTSASEELSKTKAQLDAARAQIDKSELELTSLKAQLDSTTPTTNPYYNTMLAQYNAGIKLLNENKITYQSGKAAYDEGVKKLTENKTIIDVGKLELDKAKSTLEENEKRIVSGEASLIAGEEDLKNSLTKGRKELAAARIELSKGRTTFEKEKIEALNKIKDAEKKIKDAERQLIEIPDKWFVMTREANPGYSGYGDDAKRIGAVAKVFPLFFFLVAALVCLTTMTRMIEEERSQIGILKAMGYNTFTIAIKYLAYSLLASLIGAIAGLSIGFKLFPGVIMNAYGVMYKIPVRITSFHLNYALISIFFAVVTTVTASLFATYRELRATPAVLIQPKAPVPGKRIFLERISPIWKKLSFLHKVTARNLFRYKKRLLMTVIGISGCTALLVTGFGLKDSINAIINKQFKEIFIYDSQLVLDKEKPNEERNLEKILGENKDIKAYLSTFNETVNAIVPDSGRTFGANLLVPEDLKNFKNFFDLHERSSKNKVELTTDGAVISEKLSTLLKIGVGDAFEYRDSSNRTYKIKVAAIAENYLSHYIYMSPEYFDMVTYRNPIYNSAVYNFKSIDNIDEKVFKEELLTNKGVLGVMFTKGISEKFNDTMKSLNYVVFVLILSAGTLAFVVLYNLTNINITERIREIATIKVLGFRENEVSSYVYRENILLTVIGTLVGLFLGFILHKFVMNTMEIDTMMFGREIHTLSYILSILLTIAFSILVNLFMYFKLRNVNMVESLKSVE